MPGDLEVDDTIGRRPAEDIRFETVGRLAHYWEGNAVIVAPSHQGVLAGRGDGRFIIGRAMR